jgi:hypothetical protein
VIRRAISTALVVGVPRAVLACPVCFGQSDSPLANATNMGIIAMLGIVGGVLAGFAAFIVHLNRRAKLAAANGADSPDPVVQTFRPALQTDLKVRTTKTTTPQEGIAQC